MILVLELDEMNLIKYIYDRFQILIPLESVYLNLMAAELCQRAPMMPGVLLDRIVD